MWGINARVYVATRKYDFQCLVILHKPHTETSTHQHIKYTYCTCTSLYTLSSCVYMYMYTSCILYFKFHTEAKPNHMHRRIIPAPTVTYLYIHVYTCKYARTVVIISLCKFNVMFCCSLIAIAVATVSVAA